jgi:hypothetical protein
MFGKRLLFATCKSKNLRRAWAMVFLALRAMLSAYFLADAIALIARISIRQ